jgi:TorA maturation chaperone TorD
MEDTLAGGEERAASYRALAECYHPPDERLAATLEGLSQVSDAVAGEMARSHDGPGGLEALRVDHTRLFVGPYQLLAPPYGSLYSGDTRLMGESAVAVEGFYAEEGLQVCLKQPPDHICVQLEFMCFLIRRELQAAKRAAPERVRCYRWKQARFLQQCLGPWVSDFALRVQAKAQTGFYRALGRLTDGFMRGELRQSGGGALCPPTCACEAGQQPGRGGPALPGRGKSRTHSAFRTD